MKLPTTIVALATPVGMGAIAVIRISGPDAIALCEGIFAPARKGKQLSLEPPYTIHYGSIMDGEREVDQVLVSLFHAPRSYTGEHLVEISCHGSPYIQQQIIELVIRGGAMPAQPGEFTQRAFLNGKMDLSQAEAVADLIASSGEAARRMALNQMRGGFSSTLRELRNELLTLTSLVELELDFAEEDVVFADRSQLMVLAQTLLRMVSELASSFSMGNAIKTGIPVVIVGQPNTGKSTLLNHLLREERAIVSDIPGTTRDAIEDTISIQGYSFRFVDTAGLRSTTDTVEALGIERTHARMAQATVVLLVLDASSSIANCMARVREVGSKLEAHQKLIVVINKIDLFDLPLTNQLQQALASTFPQYRCIPISAKFGLSTRQLTQELIAIATASAPNGEGVVVTNARHYHALVRARESLERVVDGLASRITGDILAIDIRGTLHYLGEITGEITTDEVLGSIFSKFCIGK